MKQAPRMPAPKRADHTRDHKRHWQRQFRRLISQTMHFK